MGSLLRAESWPLPFNEQKFIVADTEEDVRTFYEVVGGGDSMRRCRLFGDSVDDVPCPSASPSGYTKKCMVSRLLQLKPDIAESAFFRCDNDDERGNSPVAPAEITPTHAVGRKRIQNQFTFQGGALNSHCVALGFRARQAVDVLDTADAKPQKAAGEAGAWVQDALPHNRCFCRLSQVRLDLMLANEVPAAPAAAAPSETEARSEGETETGVLQGRVSTSIPTQIEADATSQPTLHAASDSLCTQRQHPGDVAPAQSSVCGKGGGAVADEDTEEDGGSTAVDNDAATSAAAADAAATTAVVLAIRRHSSGCFPMEPGAMTPSLLSQARSAGNKSNNVVDDEDEVSEALEPPVAPAAEGCAEPQLSGQGACWARQQRQPQAGSPRAMVGAPGPYNAMDGATSLHRSHYLWPPVGSEGFTCAASISTPVTGEGVDGDDDGDDLVQGRAGKATPIAKGRRPSAQGRGHAALESPYKRVRRAAAVLRAVIEEETAREEQEGEEEDDEEERAFDSADMDDEEYVVRGASGPKRIRAGPSQGRTAGRLVSGAVCRECGTDRTPQWRCGPEGPRTLCNACGVRYKKVQAGQARAAACRPRR